MENKTFNLVKASVDLSRADRCDRNPIITTQFKNIFAVGKEADLLETIRRTENPNNDTFTLPKDELELRSARIGIDPNLLELSIVPTFIESNLIEDLGDEYEIKFQNVSDVYNYGVSRIESILTEKEKGIVKVIASGMKKPILDEVLEDAINKFPKYAQKNITPYLDSTKILSPIVARDARYYTSPRIFKNRDTFNKLLKESEGYTIANILDSVSETPGIPSEIMSYNKALISGLAISGAVEPINLNINGSSKNYLFSPNILLENNSEDHLDLVKKTLSNLRYGERYSDWNLHNIEKFLESLLERGFAGRATPIGTDYRNLEDSGIIKVEKIPGDQYGRYRFWMLKKDVIEDVLNVINGNIPLDTKIPNASVYNMENTVSSRIVLSNEKSSYLREVTDAIRQIHGAILP